MKTISIMLIFWYIYPFLIMFASNFVVKRLSLTERVGVRMPDIATFFLFIGLHFLSIESFSVSMMPYVAIIILLIGIGVAIGHARYFGDIQYKRFFKMFWRITFLATVLLYTFAIIFSLVKMLKP
ncbi:DUF3397 domain-containing protein [Vagococcus elongatus]|uniref:DUF3397 domain-containing protein n=1 Tax=Vagococcus elongatus TaxID=180344 RepID=A0A430AYA0_9ENTE|nr:DUF3397 domain-containing protein [Vagococcus elongatus]RSU13051.1 hypothetical protein CBF29_05115 [Vagococcus elongatus]